MLNRVIPRLIWKPEHVFSAALNHQIYAFSFASNCELLGYSSPVNQTSDGMTLVSGLPRLEQYSCSPTCDIPGAVNECLKAGSELDFYLKAGGVWSVMNIQGDQIAAFSDFSGYHSLFYADTADYFVISNKSALVAAIAAPGSSFPEANYAALSWVYSTTMIQGQAAAFKSVKKIEPGSFLRYSVRSDQIDVRPFKTNFYTPLKTVFGTSRSAFLADRIEGLTKRTAWYVDRGIPIHSHLTGGKDSRVILGLLHHSGAIEQTRKIQTTGNEDNGDVIVARQITESLGLQDKHEVRPGNKGKSERTADEVTRALFHSFLKYDGQLTPFDGSQKPLNSFPYAATFMGGGGEILRQKTYVNHRNIEQVAAQFENWSYPYDALNILSKHEKGRQKAEIDTRASHLLKRRILNHQTKYYIDQRLSNWGCGHVQASSGNSIPLLVDIGLTRLMFARHDMAETIPFEILRATCPQLLKIPFLNQRWLGETRPLAERYDCDLDPLEVPVEKNFPWQFDVYRAHRDTFVRLVLDLWPPELDERLDRSKVEGLIGSAMEFNSAHIKMLMGLLSSIVYFDASKFSIVEDPDANGLDVVSVGGDFLCDEIQSAILQKRPNLSGHPLYEDVCAALKEPARATSRTVMNIGRRAHARLSEART